jgi:hypothetical protein
VVFTEGSAVVTQVKSVRLELDLDLRKLERAENMSGERQEPNAFRLEPQIQNLPATEIFHLLSTPICIRFIAFARITLGRLVDGQHLRGTLDKVKKGVDCGNRHGHYNLKDWKASVF